MESDYDDDEFEAEAAQPAVDRFGNTIAAPSNSDDEDEDEEGDDDDDVDVPVCRPQQQAKIAAHLKGLTVVRCEPWEFPRTRSTHATRPARGRPDIKEV